MTIAISHLSHTLDSELSSQIVTQRGVLSYDRQVSGRTADANRNHLTMAAVVWHAAKTLQLFMMEHGCIVLSSGVRVKFEHLLMFGLLDVSHGSFQILLGHLLVDS